MNSNKYTFADYVDRYCSHFMYVAALDNNKNGYLAIIHDEFDGDGGDFNDEEIELFKCGYENPSEIDFNILELCKDLNKPCPSVSYWQYVNKKQHEG